MKGQILSIIIVGLVILGASYLLSHTRSADVPDEVVPVELEMAQNASLQVTSPLMEEVIGNPLILTGEVRGTWLFEATAPVTLTNWDGLIIAEGYITAQEDSADGGPGWMTEEFVPFIGTLEYVTPEDIGEFSRRGNLIFHKSNPSGLSERDDALEYVIYFR